MTLVYILAPAPWGPIKIETAASMGDMLRRVTTQPAHVEPCDEINAGQVAEEVRKLLPAADGQGWIPTSVAAAIGRLVEVKRAVLASVVAAVPTKPVPESPAVLQEAIPIASPDVRPVRKRQRAPIGDAPGPVAAPDVDPAAVRARLGMTQASFAAAFGLSVGTVRDWEQGRYQPEGPAQVLLRVIQYQPDAVRQALGTGSP